MAELVFSVSLRRGSQIVNPWGQSSELVFSAQGKMALTVGFLELCQVYEFEVFLKIVFNFNV